MRHSLEKLFDWFMDQKVLRKTIFGYIVVILIPISIMGWLFYKQVSESIHEKYGSAQKEIISQANANINIKLAQIQSIYNFLQYNTNLSDYLTGSIGSEKEQVVEFLQYIRPLLSYTTFGNSLVNSVTIYKENPNVISFTPDMMDIREADPQKSMVAVANDDLPLDRGKWYILHRDEKEPLFLYYRKLFDKNIRVKVAVMEISVNGSMFSDFAYVPPGRKGNVYFMDASGKLVWSTEELNFDKEQIAAYSRELKARGVQYGYFKTDRDLLLINNSHLDEFDLEVITVLPTNELFSAWQGTKYAMIGMIAVMLVILTVLYYLLSLSLTRRIVKLANHMRTSPLNIPPKYEEDHYRDEIGFLVNSFNFMIKHIHELIRTVHSAELKQKEASFLALQAQIQPHFIFNTIETIRMKAESNEDTEVEEMSYMLGQMLRYTMSSGRSIVKLSEELEYAENFLKIQKIRLGARLSYQIERGAETASWKCPKFILQPLVENAIKHGIAPLRQGGYVRIECAAGGEQMVIRITDNGKGIPAERLQAIQYRLEQGQQTHETAEEQGEGGIGLYNVHERIRIHFAPGSGIQMASAPGGQTVCTVILRKENVS